MEFHRDTARTRGPARVYSVCQLMDLFHNFPVNNDVAFHGAILALEPRFRDSCSPRDSTGSVVNQPRQIYIANHQPTPYNRALPLSLSLFSCEPIVYLLLSLQFHCRPASPFVKKNLINRSTFMPRRLCDKRDLLDSSTLSLSSKGTHRSVDHRF